MQIFSTRLKILHIGLVFMLLLLSFKIVADFGAVIRHHFHLLCYSCCLYSRCSFSKRFRLPSKVLLSSWTFRFLIPNLQAVILPQICDVFALSFARILIIMSFCSTHDYETSHHFFRCIHQ